MKKLSILILEMIFLQLQIDYLIVCFKLFASGFVKSWDISFKRDINSELFNNAGIMISSNFLLENFMLQICSGTFLSALNGGCL